MSLAIQTSKRKFHKLLENLTAPPSSSRDPSSLHTMSSQTTLAHSEPSAKRVRLTPRSTIRATGRTHTAGGAVPTPPIREIKPTLLSQESFYARLATFSSLRHWTSKPDAINEVKWAARGWSLDPTRVNYVACFSSCQARLLVRLRPLRKDGDGNDIQDSEDYGVEVDEELVAKYEALIAEGHAEGCLWRQEGCGRGIMRISVARPSIWVPELRRRYNSFGAFDVARLVGRERLVLPENLDLHKVAGWLPPAFWQVNAEADKENRGENTETDEINSVKETELAFALTGWKGVAEGGNSLAVCEHCSRRIGLWLYSSIPEDGEDSMKLNLLQNHRDYCPWINGESQSMPGTYAGLPAWEILVRCIENNASFEASGKALEDHIRGSQPLDQGGHAAIEDQARPASSLRSDEDIEKEDKVRFAKLKALTSSMGLKSLRGKLSKSRA